MSDDANAKALYEINKKVLPEGIKQDLPQVQLADGTKVQTGTIGALLANIKTYDRIIAGETIESAPSKAELEQSLTVPIPTLKKVGMFDLFPPDEWIASSSAGRRYVGTKAKELGN